MKVMKGAKTGRIEAKGRRKSTTKGRKEGRQEAKE